MHTLDAKSSASPFTGAESSLRDKVLGEVEKGSLIALPGRGGHSGVIHSKSHGPAWRR